MTTASSRLTPARANLLFAPGLALATLVQARVAHADLVVRTRREGGLAAAQQLVAAGDGKRIMVAARRVLPRRDDEERRLLARRNAASQRAERRVPVVTTVARGEAVGWLGTAFRSCRSENRRSEAALRGSGAKFRALIGVIGVARDITERKLAEAGVRESEARLRKVIDGLGPYMFVGLLTRAGVLIEANAPALAAAGLRPEDVLGQPFEETYWWAYSETVQQQLRAAIERAVAGTPSRYDVQVRAAEGVLIWIDFSLHPLRDEAGQVAFLVPSANIITERKRAAEALRESMEWFAAAFRANPAGVAITTLEEGRFLAVNDAFLRIFSRSRDAIIGHTAVELGILTNAEERRRILAAVRRDGAIQDWELPFRRADGSEGQTLRSIVRLVLGGKDHLLTLVLDITARKQAERRQAETTTLLRGLLGRTVTFTRNEPQGTRVTVRVPCANEPAVSTNGAAPYQPGATPQVADRPGDKG